jgi:hypothetical protein
MKWLFEDWLTRLLMPSTDAMPTHSGCFGTMTAFVEISAPLHPIAEGPTNIAAQFQTLWDVLAFFVQQVHSGIVTIDGNRATSRWSVQETGRRHDRGPYNNHGFTRTRWSSATAVGGSCVGGILL